MASTAFANEVTETKHNNKNDAADAAAATTTAAAAATLGAAEDKRGPGTLSISADNDKKKNGSGGNIGDARENYKFDVST